jgi:hypothetical protein
MLDGLGVRKRKCWVRVHNNRAASLTSGFFQTPSPSVAQVRNRQPPIFQPVHVSRSVINQCLLKSWPSPIFHESGIRLDHATNRFDNSTVFLNSSWVPKGAADFRSFSSDCARGGTGREDRAFTCQSLVVNRPLISPKQPPVKASDWTSFFSQLKNKMKLKKQDEYQHSIQNKFNKS